MTVYHSFTKTLLLAQSCRQKPFSSKSTFPSIFFSNVFSGYRKRPVPFYLPMILDNFEKEEHASLNDISQIEIKTKQQLHWTYHPMEQMVPP